MLDFFEGRRSEEFACKICGFPHLTAADARACEDKGIKGNELRVGDKLLFPINGGILLQVTALLLASHLTHDPGVRTKVVSGDTLEEQVFDEETAKKYLVE